MLPVHRFKVELVGYVKVGRDSLRVAIDHDGFIPYFPDGHDTVYTAVVKFNTLADAVWT